MTLAIHVQNRLTSLGISCSVVGDEVHINTDKRPVKIRFDEQWTEAYTQYKRARSLSFDLESRVLTHNNSVEVMVKRLSLPTVDTSEQYNLSDSSGNTVQIGTATKNFAFSFFDSVEYERFFNLRVKKRLLNIAITTRRMPQILWMPSTAIYKEKGRKIPAELKEKAIGAIERSLFKIAVEQNDCLSIYKPNVRRLKFVSSDDSDHDQSIPRSNYDENVVSYYKVALASPFPSQSFLAYYHVLEYFFLRVSEEVLHDRLTTLLNEPSFRANKKSLDKLISSVRGQDARSDETEMLRNVLNRFVREDDLIRFVNKLESEVGEKIYSKKRKVFGEDLQVTPMKDLAIPHAARTLKHVRNAIVHSSDKYKREDCHVPLSDSENIIDEFIPLVRFLAEKIIYGTAS